MRPIRFPTRLGLLLIGLSSMPGLAQETEIQVAGRTLEGWAKDLKSPNEIVRLRAVKSLGPFGVHATDTLVKALDDESDGVRYWAASHLGAIGPEAELAVSRLKTLANDDDNPAVQMAVAFALCRIDNVDENISVLIERLDYPERGMACSAAEFLGRLGQDARSAVPALVRGYHANSREESAVQKPDPDYHIQGACQNALRQIIPDWKPGPPPSEK